MSLTRLPDSFHLPPNPTLHVLYHRRGQSILHLPSQIPDVPKRDGYDRVSHPDCERDGCCEAQDEGTVSADDGAGHAGDEDVQETGQDTLAGGRGWGEGGDGAGEGLFEVEGVGKVGVQAPFCEGGITVEGQAGGGNVCGEAIGWGWAASI